MKNKDIEVEIKVQIENSNNLLRFLKENAKFLGEERQVDEYFTPAHRDFTKFKPVKEWLRIRNSKDKFSINYKNWYYDKNGRGIYCDEFETELNDINQFRKIFEALNFKNAVVVNKLRKIWEYKNYEIAIDKVKKLGDFVEIEFKGKSKLKPEEVNQEMIDFLKKIGVGKIVRNYVGYPHQLLLPQDTDNEEV